MKISKMILLSLPLTLLISACGQKIYLSTECPTIEPIDKIERLKLLTDDNSQLDANSSYNAIVMIRQYRIKEKYNDGEIKALRIKVNELKDKE